MSTEVREAPHHNNTTCYTEYRCRLPECVRRYNEANTRRLRAQKEGTWDRLVPAEPVRRHLLALQAENIGPGAVAYSTGLRIQTVQDFLKPNTPRRRPRRQRTSPETAAKILSVTPENYASGKIPSAGTIRRLQALVAAGWPLSRIATEAGLDKGNLSQIWRRSLVYGSTVTAVAAAYEELRNQDPARHGIDPVQVKRAKGRAHRRRWPTIAYWADRMDVIDDPDFEPLYGVTRREIVAQDASWVMRTTGLDKAATAERLGVSKSYIDHAFRDHPEYAVEVAA